jgi:hypothetical protein
MRHHLRPPSASTVIASIALIAALGGTSYAASTITSSDIKNNTIKSADVRNSSLTGKDVKNSSLTSGDIKNGSLLAKDFQAGQTPGAGPQGPPGPRGPAGFGSLSYVAGQTVAVPTLQEGVAYAYCPPGLLPTGGGVSSSSNPPDLEPPFDIRRFTVNSSFPFLDQSGAGWEVWVENDTPDMQEATAVAICAPGTRAQRSALTRSKRRR